MLKVLFLSLIFLASPSFAEEVIDISGVEKSKAMEQCLANPEANAEYTNGIEAGWAAFGLGSVIEEIKFYFPDVKIEEFWSYGLFSRSVDVRITGKCLYVVEAAIGFESIRPKSILAE